MNKMEVPIVCNIIPYLERNHMDKYADIYLISNEKNLVKIHSLALLTFSSLFQDNIAAIFEEDLVIITEYTLNELLEISNFIMEGILPTLNVSTKKLFQSFGIHINELWKILEDSENYNDISDFKEQKYVATKRNFKVESINFMKKPKEEQIELNILKSSDHFLTLENLDTSHLDILEDFENNVKMINNEKNYSKCEYCQKDYQLKILKRHIKTVHGVEPRPKLNIHEKSVYDEYMNLAKKYSHIIKVCPPENYGPTPQELEKYNLSKEIESYIQIPEQTNEIDDYSPPNSKITKYNTSNYKNPVQCSKCPLKFSNANKLENHDLLNHSSHYQCNNCQKVYSLNLKEEFKIHIYRHEKMNVKAHECIHCGFSSFIAKSMIQHLNHAGPYHTNSCAHCQNKFQNYEDFKSHMETSHPGIPSWICSHCGELFLTLDILNIHQTEHSKKETTTKISNNKLEICEFCGKTFPAKINLSHHIARNHKKINPDSAELDIHNFQHQCAQCFKVFETAKSLQSHITKSHAKYACDKCGRMIGNKHRARHMQQFHTAPENRKNKCEICGKGFSTNQSLRDHVNIHTGERPYVCKICGKKFASSGNKQMHLRTTHLGYKRIKKSLLYENSNTN